MNEDTGSRVNSMACLDDASYVLGILSPVERQNFEQHLAGCKSCQAAVARLAGLPSLLALTSAADLDSGPAEVPESLLPNLLSAAARERRRKRWIWTGTVAAAAACVLALVITLVVRPATATNTAIPAEAVAMKQILASPMAVSLQLSDKQWGTSIVINCHYTGTHDAGEAYKLVAFDGSGKPQDLGWWKSVAGGGSTVTTASSLRLAEISRIEVQLTDGTPVLSAVP